ncbi:hypothetical protein DV20_01205 [Amycolatopsis rifamycinica]|uniref:Uncharacterized protein n=1 Tax=Amycolatopsis rifamycinica TaxID=287986 RepID=A0A066U990_9PSEU|nr:LysR family transcriptional regulator [Amycolatopsis rifamycinica]KDN24036.1 hypothetical protein DV20_01205 [Amycolatopsis rifamycinica]
MTEAGRVFATEARITLRSLDRAIRRTRQAGRGVLRVATAPGTGSGVLREMVRAYLARFGRDTVELVFTRDQTVGATGPTAPRFPPWGWTP